MPNFKVLRNIELNDKLYIPQSDDAPEQAVSACHGRPIPVDASGIIELSYEPGDTVRLDAEQASKLLADGSVAAE